MPQTQGLEPFCLNGLRTPSFTHVASSPDASWLLKRTMLCDMELLAIKLALEQWRHWIEASPEPFIVWTDHKNLEYLKTAKRLNPRQARFSRFNFDLSYRPGSKNLKPDALSRLHRFSVQSNAPEEQGFILPSKTSLALTTI